MTIPEDSAQDIQVVCFIARLRSNGARLKLLENPVWMTWEFEHRSIRPTPNRISLCWK
jgi:hypothetical protein